jgi:hypothetical protein
VSATKELPRVTGSLSRQLHTTPSVFQPCTAYRKSHDAVRDAGLGVGFWEDQQLMKCQLAVLVRRAGLVICVWWACRDRPMVCWFTDNFC